MLEVITIFLSDYFDHEIDVMRNFDTKPYSKNPFKYGDHLFKVKDHGPPNYKSRAKKVLFEFDRKARFEINKEGVLIQYSLEKIFEGKNHNVNMQVE